MPLKNTVQLMTYPNSLGGNIKNLHTVIDKYLKDAIGFVHILPPYPSSADRGFAPLTHLQIDPEFGEWEDVQSLASQYDLMLDIIAGHISDKSVYFQDYLQKGEKSEFYDMFNRVEKVFKDQKIGIEEILNFDLLGPIPPLQIVYLENGQKKLHFNTFMPYQIDLDICSEATKKLIKKFIQKLSQKGVNTIRLDAIETFVKDRKFGYNKAPGVYKEIQWLVSEVKNAGMNALCEFFGNEDQAQKILDIGGLLYDYTLSENILYSLFSSDFKVLEKHFDSSFKHRNSLITYISNHDGLRVGDYNPILNKNQLNFTKQKIFEHAGESTQKASGLNSNNIDVNRINTTLFEACYRDQNLTYIAQALLLFAPGTPQLYYNDILMERNDEDSYKETGEGRSLLRHNFTIDQIEHKFKQPGTQRLVDLMKHRNNNPAFLGDLKTKVLQDGIELVWKNNTHTSSLKLTKVDNEYKLKVD